MRHVNRPRFLARAISLVFPFLFVSLPAIGETGRLHKPPLLGDHYRTWTFQSMSRMNPHDLGDFYPFRPDAEWVAEYASDQGSIYSDLQQRLFSVDVVTPIATGPQLGSSPNDPRSARIIAWDLGLDKALPGYQVMPYYPRAYPGDLQTQVQANLRKAGVSKAIFLKVQALTGPNLSSLGAEMAVAAQILDDWVSIAAEAATKAALADQEASRSAELHAVALAAGAEADEAALGVRGDVLERLHAATYLSDLTDQDLAYLADILRAELSVWRAGRYNRSHQRAIPTPLRIARVAAAHRASQPGYDACLADGSRNPARAGNDPESMAQPICFTDATDRAVYRWYRAQRRVQLAQPTESFPDFGLAARLIESFGDIRPAWAGAYTARALDWSNHAEVVEAQIASSFSSSDTDDIGILRLNERANSLICKEATP